MPVFIAKALGDTLLPQPYMAGIDHEVMVVTLAIDLDLAESEDFRFHVLAIGRNHGHTLAVLTNPRCIVLLVLVAGGAALAQPNLEAPASPRLGGIKFIWIPTGSFQMGSQAGSAEIESRYGGEARFFGVEHPRHGVRLTRGFWLGSCPVLNEQFEIFVKATGYRTEAEREGWGLGYDGKIGHSNKVNGLAWQHPGHRIQARQPVVMVSWNDAQAYIRWLNGGGEEGYRLPTEAEWECACRAGSASAYSFGDDASRLGEYAWFAQNAGYVTHPAGQKKPNPWGFTTCTAMSGNGARTGWGIIRAAVWWTPKAQPRANTASCAAAPGTAPPCIAARPIAARTAPTRATSAWAFVWRDETRPLYRSKGTVLREYPAAGTVAPVPAATGHTAPASFE